LHKASLGGNERKPQVFRHLTKAKKKQSPKTMPGKTPENNKARPLLETHFKRDCRGWPKVASGKEPKVSSEPFCEA
jgi:hypothetical protein